LQGRNVKEDEGNNDSEDHGREKKVVLGRFVEHGRLLKDTQTPGTGSEQVEDLPGVNVRKVACRRWG
jgi:hypothetical protein